VWGEGKKPDHSQKPRRIRELNWRNPLVRSKSGGKRRAEGERKDIRPRTMTYTRVEDPMRKAESIVGTGFEVYSLQPHELMKREVSKGTSRTSKKWEKSPAGRPGNTHPFKTNIQSPVRRCSVERPKCEGKRKKPSPEAAGRAAREIG